MESSRNTGRAVIFANGEVPSLAALRAVLTPGDFLIAADGGTRWLTELGLTPNLLVGDLDSISPAARDLVNHPGVEVVLHPQHKDQTDLELALDQAIVRGYRTIRIAGAAGGRLDHALGNLMLITDPGLASLDVRLDDGTLEAAAVRRRALFRGTPGDLLSLLPLEVCRGVTLEGLEYPLDGETLHPHQTRGISNVFTSTVARVSLESGLLLGLHTRIP